MCSTVVLAIVRVRVSQRHIQVRFEPIRHLRRDVGTSAVTLEVRSLQDTVLVHIAQREHILGLFCILQQGIHPVLVPYRLCIGTHHARSRINDVVPRIVLKRIVEFAAQGSAQILAGGSLCIGPSITIGESIAVAQSLVSQLHEVLLSHHVILVDGARRPTHGRTPCHVGLAFLTLFGRNHDNAVGATSAIQRAGRSILQDSHRLNVRRVDVRQRTVIRNTVHHIQRTGRSIDRTITTDDDRSRLARLSGAGSRQDTRSLSFKAFRHVRDRTRFQFLIANRRSRTREGRLLCRAVSHDHHLVQQLRVGFHADGHILLNLSFLRVHSHVRNYQSPRRTWYVRQSELTVHVGNRTLLGAFYHHRRSNNRLPVFIGNHNTCDPLRLGSYQAYPYKKTGQ